MSYSAYKEHVKKNKNLNAQKKKKKFIRTENNKKKRL